MTTEEIQHLISIGFCQPKFYKPHVWRKAKVIMEWLCENTQLVERFDFGRGKGKYQTKNSWDKDIPFEKVKSRLAQIYFEQGQ